MTRKSVLWSLAEPRLEMLRLRTSICPAWYGGVSMPAKATSADLEGKRRTSPISAMSCDSREGPPPYICMTTGYSGKVDAKSCIWFFKAANAAEDCHTSNTEMRNWNPSFSHCRFNLLSDMNTKDQPA